MQTKIDHIARDKPIPFLDLPRQAIASILQRIDSEHSVDSEKTLAKLSMTSQSMRRAMQDTGVLTLHKDRAKIFAMTQTGKLHAPIMLASTNPRLREACKIQFCRLAEERSLLPHVQEAYSLALALEGIQDAEPLSEFRKQRVIQALTNLDTALFQTSDITGQATSESLSRRLLHARELLQLSTTEKILGIDNFSSLVGSKAFLKINTTFDFRELLGYLKQAGATGVIGVAVEDRLTDAIETGFMDHLMEEILATNNSRLATALSRRLCHSIERGNQDSQLHRGSWVRHRLIDVRTAVKDRVLALIQDPSSPLERRPEMLAHIEKYTLADTNITEAIQARVLLKIQNTSKTTYSYDLSVDCSMMRESLITPEFEAKVFSIFDEHLKEAKFNLAIQFPTLPRRVLENYACDKIAASDNAFQTYNAIELYTPRVNAACVNALLTQVPLGLYDNNLKTLMDAFPENQALEDVVRHHTSTHIQHQELDSWVKAGATSAIGFRQIMADCIKQHSNNRWTGDYIRPTALTRITVEGMGENTLRLALCELGDSFDSLDILPDAYGLRSLNQKNQDGHTLLNKIVSENQYAAYELLLTLKNRSSINISFYDITELLEHLLTQKTLDMTMLDILTDKIAPPSRSNTSSQLIPCISSLSLISAQKMLLDKGFILPGTSIDLAMKFDSPELLMHALQRIKTQTENDDNAYVDVTHSELADKAIIEGSPKCLEALLDDDYGVSNPYSYFLSSFLNQALKENNFEIFSPLVRYGFALNDLPFAKKRLTQLLKTQQLSEAKTLLQLGLKPTFMQKFRFSKQLSNA